MTGEFRRGGFTCGNLRREFPWVAYDFHRYQCHWRESPWALWHSQPDWRWPRFSPVAAVAMCIEHLHRDLFVDDAAARERRRRETDRRCLIHDDNVDRWDSNEIGLGRPHVRKNCCNEHDSLGSPLLPLRLVFRKSSEIRKNIENLAMLKLIKRRGSGSTLST